MQKYMAKMWYVCISYQITHASELSITRKLDIFWHKFDVYICCEHFNRIYITFFRIFFFHLSHDIFICFLSVVVCLHSVEKYRKLCTACCCRYISKQWINKSHFIRVSRRAAAISLPANKMDFVFIVRSPTGTLKNSLFGPSPYFYLTQILSPTNPQH